MTYFWESFWGVIFVAAGATIASVVGWIWWLGALIGLGVYLVVLFLVKNPDAIPMIIDEI